MDTDDELKPLELKWGREVIRGGFTAMPTMLLQRQVEFGISPLEMNIILNLADHWFDARDLPFPSYSTLSSRIGGSVRQLQRAIKDLEARGFLERQVRFVAVKGQSSNYFSLAKLIEKLRERAITEPILHGRKEREPKRARRIKVSSSAR